jgi:hypothetical protein
MPNDAITPFTLAVPQADLDDLNRRIDQTRWPDGDRATRNGYNIEIAYKPWLYK